MTRKGPIEEGKQRQFSLSFYLVLKRRRQDFCLAKGKQKHRVTSTWIDLSLWRKSGKRKAGVLKVPSKGSVKSAKGLRFFFYSYYGPPEKPFAKRRASEKEKFG